jgi:flavin reductase (DIM6/NTAB) family NADH-FMN oxidoreductase RutF
MNTLSWRGMAVPQTAAQFPVAAHHDGGACGAVVTEFMHSGGWNAGKQPGNYFKYCSQYIELILFSINIHRIATEPCRARPVTAQDHSAPIPITGNGASMSSEIAKLFRSISLGVHVIAIAHEDRHEAFTAASLMQVSYKPLRLALAASPAHHSWPLLERAGAFGVSVLDRGQIGLARHFGQRSGAFTDKFEGLGWSSLAGMPVLDEALAWFACQVEQVVPAGDHNLVLARVVDGRLLKPQATPLLYAGTGNLDGSEALYPDRFE